jgi:hypothetical protein
VTGIDLPKSAAKAGKKAAAPAEEE